MIRTCLIAAWIFLSHAAAQTIPYEANYQFGGHIPSANSWGGPFALDLVPVAGGLGGKVWLRQTPDGILIFGRITGGRLEYARFPAEMGTRAYVGIWLAASRDVEMPELGWGNQFGLTNCKHIDNPPRGSLEGCQSWEARQLKYREQLRRVFVRHWKLAPGVPFETDASEAYRNALAFMSDRDHLDFAKLEPRGGPLMDLWDFEIFIRWSDFPPANLLKISKIYFALDLCEPDHPCSSTSPNRKDGDPSTFRELTLERPKVSSTSPCGHPLEQTDLFGNRYPAWYFPNTEGRAADTFALENDIRGYQYNPDGLSPIPVWKHYFSKPVGTAEVVCGPDLRYVAGTKTYGSDGVFVQGRAFVQAGTKTYVSVHGHMQRFDPIIDENQLGTWDLADGAHLLRSGPTVGTLSPLGSGQCGSCPTADLTIYHLSPATGITVAFQEQLVLDGQHTADGDIQVAPDWRTLTVYRSASTSSADQTVAKEAWSSKRYCLSGVMYEECGDGPSTAPPSPRQIQWTR
jgi:hypothetical protein